MVARTGAELTADRSRGVRREPVAGVQTPGRLPGGPSLPRTEVGRLDRGAVLRNFARTPSATLPWLTAVAPSSDGTTVNGAPGTAEDGGSEQGAGEAVDIAPEQVADLDELGVRLPASGSREERGDQDTDEDLF